MLLASQSGSTKLIQMLVAKGASVQSASESGVTPLMILSAAGNLRGTKVSLEAAAPLRPITRPLHAVLEAAMSVTQYCDVP